MSIEKNAHWADHLPTGWAALYLNLLADLAAAGCRAEVIEAKEKFGSMRIYFQHADAAARTLVTAAEQHSKTICQTCGDQGELLVRDHHFATLCPLHGKGYSRPQRTPIVTLNLRDLSVEE